MAALLLNSCGDEAAQDHGPVIMAAASLQLSLDDVADAWVASGRARPVIYYAGSPSLARQIRSGAPADIVFLADEAWMDQLETEGAIAPGTRRALLGNRLALVKQAHAKRRLHGNIRAQLRRLSRTNRLAMADPNTVPAGRYGKHSLESLKLWDMTEPFIAPTDNVRAAAAFVERGQAPLGLVYETDLRASPKLVRAASIPKSAQPTIRYPIAILIRSKHAEAQDFVTFLASSEAEAVFTRHGFSRLAER